MKKTEPITLGVGDLYIDNEDAGYLGGDVTVTTETESVDFKHGTHQTLIKRFVTTLSRTIKASLAQLDIDTLKLALGIGEVIHGNNLDRMNFGKNWQLLTLRNVKFVHVRDDGQKVTIFFPKAQVEPGSSELKFSADSVIMQDVTISAVEDDSRADCPMGFIQVGDSDYTGEIGGPGPEGHMETVIDEVVTGEAEETWYNYQLAHRNIVMDPAPVVKSENGETTYEKDRDFFVDANEGIITTNGVNGTRLTGGTTIKVSYSYIA